MTDTRLPVTDMSEVIIDADLVPSRSRGMSAAALISAKGLLA